MFYSYGFMPLINRPTRIAHTSASIIDNILTNNHTDIANSQHGILLTDVSDHFPIFHINGNIQNVEQSIKIVKRSYSVLNKQKIVEELGNTDFSL